MESYSDDELLYLARCGNQDAEMCLYKRYYKRISKWLLPLYKYCHQKIDYQDFVQIGMMNFVIVVDSYRDDRQASMRTFIKQSISRRVISYARSLESENYYLHQSISLDEEVGEEGMCYEELIEDPKQNHHPAIEMKIKEMQVEYAVELEERLSHVEYLVMKYTQAGYSQKEIAKILDISIKSVYNAIYRYHKKMQPLT